MNKKSCLILALAVVGVLILSVFAIGSCVYSKRDAIMEGFESAFELPAYATEAAQRERHGATIDQIVAAASEAETFFEFAAAVEKLSLPEELIYLACEVDGEEQEIRKTLQWSGHSIRVLGTYGSGTLHTSEGKQAIAIVNETSPDASYMEELVLYFTYDDIPPEG